MPTKKKSKKDIRKNQEEKSNAPEINDEFKEMNLSIRKKEIYWIIGVMAGLIVLILIISSLIQGSNTFTYKALKFTKTKYGELPVFLYNYNFKDPRTTPPKEYSFNFLLRKDPRTNTVPVDGNIEFGPAGSTVYVGINGSSLSQCKTSNRDLASLSSFLTINLFTIKTGLADKAEAEKSNYTHVACSNFPSNVVIMVQSGNQTRVEKSGSNCYNINIANCETLEGIEKFEVQSIIDAKNRKSAV